MKLIKYTIASIAMMVILLTTGCRDEFADINTNPSQISKADPSFLFTRGILEFEPSGYLLWYYNAPMTMQWSQMATPTAGFLPNFVQTTANGDQGYKYIAVLKYVRDIENYRSNLNEEESRKYAGYAAALDVLAAYIGVFDSDMFGYLPFQEACRAAYGGTLTPAYDSVETLYELWLSQLDQAISVFNNPSNLLMTATQDIVYGGSWSKWAKLANSVKLRIAARLINIDKNKALQIAASVASAPSGYIDSLEDAFLFNKAISASGDNNDFVYHWSNGFLDAMAGSQRVIDFMVENQDPRVRFCYQKNSYNSKVIQSFYDKGKAIPHYIEEKVNYTESEGKKTFVSWKEPGEPWVRYYGIPVELNASSNQAQYGDWFDSPRFQNTDMQGNNLTSYTPYSRFQQQMVIGRYYNFTLPKAPGQPVTQTTDPRPWYGLYLGAGEVNLYLAEFKLLGANIPGDAATYYNKGVINSIEEYNSLAKKNKIAYYERNYGYDELDAPIELKAGEIDAMFTNEDYQLTGTSEEKIEKVYLQQLLNFTLYPNEQFVTARRSGLPKFGSKFLPREKYPSVPETSIPRRFDTGTPSKTDLMYQNYIDAYSKQGFTISSPGGSNTSILNTERVWSDKNNPQFGEGPKE